MSDQSVRPANCAACAFWRKLREHEGLCARHAPETSIRPDEAAHFPQTHNWQWCGEGVAAEPMSIGSRCADCVYWRRPEGGLNPVNRRDMPMAWWARAGICARHAPRPVPEPGPRSFWRATQGAGLLRRGPAAARRRGTSAAAMTGTSGARQPRGRRRGQRFQARKNSSETSFEDAAGERPAS